MTDSQRGQTETSIPRLRITERPGDPSLTEREREAIVLALKYCLGHEIAVSPMEINPIWRSALVKVRASLGIEP